MFEIMAEFVTATEHLQSIQPAVSIFGSARVAPTHPYYAVAEDIARRLSDAGFSVISGGGPGIMEAANKGAFAGTSPSVGLNIQLPFEQSGNKYQDVSHTFQHFFARKVMFVKSACAFVMMPGGFGTMDELFEILALSQTRKMAPVPVVLVGEDYWRRAFNPEFFVEQGVIDPEDRELFWFAETPQQIWQGILRWYEKKGQPLLMEQS